MADRNDTDEWSERRCPQAEAQMSGEVESTIQTHCFSPVNRPSGGSTNGCGLSVVYSAKRSTATISCSVSAETVRMPFRRSVMGRAYAKLNPTKPTCQQLSSVAVRHSQEQHQYCSAVLRHHIDARECIGS